MDKSKDNSINYFSFSPKNSKNIHQNDEYENNPQKKNQLFKNNFCERSDLNCGVPKSNLNYPDQGTEDNFNRNKNLEDSNMSEAISETSKQDLTVCECINIHKIINQSSVHNKMYYKNKKKIFFIYQNNRKSSIINNQKTNAKKRNIFNVEYPNCFKIFHPGSYEQYPRDLINSILENKTNIPLSKRSKIKKKRKFYSDNIRRKIKCTFHNSLKNTLNNILKYTNSKYFFECLPQNFITNVTKDGNKHILNMTFKQLFLKYFIENEDKASKKDLEKCKVNFLVIVNIEGNDDLREKSKYNNYKNMKYYEIYYEYLKSKEFEEDIIKLEKTESKEYIKQYINLALHLIDYFSSD